MYIKQILALLIYSTALLAQAETIKIGWIGPLTGNSAVLGIDSLQAAQIAIDEANSESPGKFELLAEDDQYDTAKSVSAYSRLASKGAVAIISSTYGGIFATAEKALKDDVIVINPLDCNDEIAKLPENTFCIATQSESVGRVIAEDIQSKKNIPVGIIYDEKNPFMTIVANVIKSAVKEDLVYLAPVDQNIGDFKAELLRAKSKNISSLVLLGHDPMGKAMQQTRALNVQARFYTVGTITSPVYQKLAGKAAEGALVAYWEAPNSKEFEKFIVKFKEKTGRPPILELATIPTYDSAKILTLALSNSRISASDVRQFLLELKDYQGLSGKISMDRDGAVRTIHEAIYKFEAGKLEK